MGLRGARSDGRSQTHRKLSAIKQRTVVMDGQDEIRTHTCLVLNQVPLPVGLPGHDAWEGIRTLTGQLLGLVPLPVGLPRRDRADWI